jgi:hypothetical protein
LVIAILPAQETPSQPNEASKDSTDHKNETNGLFAVTRHYEKRSGDSRAHWGVGGRALKIFDDFLLDAAIWRLCQRIQKLAPHRPMTTVRSGFLIPRLNARDHVGHGDVPSSCLSVAQH